MSKEETKESKGAKDVSAMLNSCSFSNKDFCKTMSEEHRYLQNEFTNLCIEWLRTCASPDYRFDGRNEWSHKASEVMIKALDERY